MSIVLALLYLALAFYLMKMADDARNWPTQVGYVLLALASVAAAVLVR